MKANPAPVYQRLNPIDALSRTARAVLIEVCSMAANGGRGVFDATNEHLVAKVGGTVRTVSRTLAALTGDGLLLVDGATKRRTLRPAPFVAACYTGSEAEQLAAVAALESLLSIDTDGDSPEMSIDKPGAVYRHPMPVSIDIHGATIDTQGVTCKEDEQNEQLTNTYSFSTLFTLPTTFAATAAPLEAEVERLKDLLSKADARLVKAADTYRADQATIAGLRAELAAKVTPPPPAPKRPSKPVTEPDPATSLLIGVYRDWFADRFKAQPNIRPMDGKAAKDAAAYLRSLADPKAPDVNAAAAEVLQGLLRGWETYETYLRKQTTLAQICGNLTNLIAARHQPALTNPTALHLNTDGPHYRQPTAQQPRGYGNNAGFRSGIDLAAVAKGAADLL